MRLCAILHPPDCPILREGKLKQNTFSANKWLAFSHLWHYCFNWSLWRYSVTGLGAKGLQPVADTSWHTFLFDIPRLFSRNFKLDLVFWHSYAWNDVNLFLSVSLSMNTGNRLDQDEYFEAETWAFCTMTVWTSWRSLPATYYQGLPKGFFGNLYRICLKWNSENGIWTCMKKGPRHTALMWNREYGTTKITQVWNTVWEEGKYMKVGTWSKALLKFELGNLPSP